MNITLGGKEKRRQRGEKWEVFVPASKSHTIRALFIAAFAEGESFIERPLASLDTEACVAVCRAFGAHIEEQGAGLSVRGIFRGGKCRFDPACAAAPLDVANSGTTLFFALALAAHAGFPVTFTGDAQIQRRSAAPLLAALDALGIPCAARDGCAPITIGSEKSAWRGGDVVMECPTSQYLSALLLAAPLAANKVATRVTVPLLNEKPYIDMTLAYLSAQHIVCDCAADYASFVIPGGQRYAAFSRAVSADFSSAAFPALAALATDTTVTLRGLDRADTQGDKVFFHYIEEMGGRVEWNGGALGGAITVSRGARPLHGGTFDLNDTPDMLPALAALAAFAEGETVIKNAAHARLKESDRVAVMAENLAKLGVAVTERSDGLVIGGTGGINTVGNIGLESHGDHRVGMALAAAALASPVPLVVTGAEAAAVTYPNFFSSIVPGGRPPSRLPA